MFGTRDDERIVLLSDARCWKLEFCLFFEGRAKKAEARRSHFGSSDGRMSSSQAYVPSAPPAPIGNADVGQVELDVNPTEAKGRTLAVIAVAVKFYYFVDACWAFTIASLALALNLIVDALNVVPESGGPPCAFTWWMKTGSTIVILTRCYDFTMGCVDMCCSNHAEQFGKYCVRNMYLAIFQCVVGLGNAVLALLAIIVCEKTMAIVSFIFGILLFLTAIEEAYIWVLCYILWHAVKHGTGDPEWVDGFISKYFPSCLLSYIDRHK